MTQTLRVGWVGTGVMGAPMAGHLQAAGYPLTVFNRTKAKAEKLLQSGAKWAATPADVLRASDVVFAIVGFPADVRQTFLGPDGLCSAARPGQILVDMTTSPPSLAVEIAAAAKHAGAHFIDAPVSGGQVGAETAKLTIMTGGEKEIFDKILPLFQRLGKSATWLGPAGSGQHCKMVNQILIAGTMLSLGEALTYAQNCGINAGSAVEAISQGAAGSWSLNNLAPRMLKQDYAAGFYVDHFVKDLGIALEEAKRMKLSLPMIALAEQLYVSLQAQGHGRLGTQAIAKVYDKLAGK